MMKQSNKSDVMIVGSGVAGLTAAVYLAQAGQKVIILEQSQHIGGRATTQVKDGFYFNQGPHALYRAGAGARILRELGVEFQGGVPSPAGYALRNGEPYTLPGSPLSLLTTRLLGVRAKFEVARFLILSRIKSRPFGVS